MKTQKEIADELGITAVAVSRKISKLGLEPVKVDGRKKFYSDEQISKLISVKKDKSNIKSEKVVETVDNTAIIKLINHLEEQVKMKDKQIEELIKSNRLLSEELIEVNHRLDARLSESNVLQLVDKKAVLNEQKKSPADQIKKSWIARLFKY